MTLQLLGTNIIEVFMKKQTQTSEGNVMLGPSSTSKYKYTNVKACSHGVVVHRLSQVV
jgi:hypothetical protein